MQDFFIYGIFGSDFFRSINLFYAVQRFDRCKLRHAYPHGHGAVAVGLIYYLTIQPAYFSQNDLSCCRLVLYAENEFFIVF